MQPSNFVERLQKVVLWVLAPLLLIIIITIFSIRDNSDISDGFSSIGEFLGSYWWISLIVIGVVIFTIKWISKKKGVTNSTSSTFSWPTTKSIVDKGGVTIIIVIVIILLMQGLRIGKAFKDDLSRPEPSPYIPAATMPANMLNPSDDAIVLYGNRVYTWNRVPNRYFIPATIGATITFQFRSISRPDVGYQYLIHRVSQDKVEETRHFDHDDLNMGGLWEVSLVGCDTASVLFTTHPL